VHRYIPRRRTQLETIQRRDTQARTLTALPPKHPQALDRQALVTVQHSHLKRIENYRTHYGRSLDLSRIDYTIRSANNGFMRPMADLGRESISLSGHANSVLQKRLNRVTSLPWRTEPASGAGVDRDKARDYQREVESQMRGLKRFRSRLRDLAWASFDGRSALEVEWQFVGGPWPYRAVDLHWMHPRRLSFGQQRDLRIVDADQWGGDFSDTAGYPIERGVPFKFVVRKPRLFSDYPEREGLCPRILYWTFFSRFGVRERLILMELFGKPWRILEQDQENPNDEDLEESFDALQALGATNTARLARGLRATVVSPDAKGEVHKDTIEHAELTISKLVLGSTSTTDAQPAGLGSNQSEVHKTEEDLIIEGDGADCAESIEDYLVDAIIAVNRGPHELINAPRFFIEPEQRKDPKEELDTIEKAASIGLAVGVDDARERSGFRPPNEGEAILVQVHPEAPMGQPAPAPRIAVVYPPGKAPQPGELRPEPTAEVNLPEGTPAPPGPAQQSLPGIEEPPSQMPPTGDPEPNTPEEARDLARKMTELGIERCEHGRPNRCPMCGVERSRDVELDEATGEPKWAVAWKAIGDSRQMPAEPPPDIEERAEVASALNSSKADSCGHGRKRKCRDCGVVRAKAGAPWRAMDDAGRVVL